MAASEGPEGRSTYDGVTLGHDALRAVARRLLAAAGAAPPDAGVVAGHLVDAHLAGHDSHGVGMLPQYFRAIEAGLLRPTEHVRLEDDGGPVLGADGRHGFGQVVAREAVAAAMARARALGLALVALRDAAHVGRIGAYGEQAAAAGLVSVHFVNVVGHAPVVAPFRGTDARLLTNPLCVALPVRGAPPILVDFATSALALGKVRVAHQRAAEVPPDVLLDEEGRPTRDPSALFGAGRHGALLPFGFHKGYALAVACELLAGAAGAGRTIATVPPAKDRITNNMLSVVIDPGRLPGAAAFADELAAAVAHLKASPPADPALPVLVPGEPEAARRRELLDRGITVERATWDELRGWGERLGVRVEAAG